MLSILCGRLLRETPRDRRLWSTMRNTYCTVISTRLILSNRFHVIGRNPVFSLLSVRCCSGNVIDRAQKKKSVPQSKSVVPPVKFTSVVASLTGAKPGQQKRNCFHPGISSLNRDALNLEDKPSVTSVDMLRAMLRYIWPEDDPEIRKRVKIAVGLLVGAKILNVTVPFIFKYAVDVLNTHSVATTGTAVMGLTTAPATVATVATSLLVGCKDVNILFSRTITSFIKTLTTRHCK